MPKILTESCAAALFAITLASVALAGPLTVTVTDGGVVTATGPRGLRIWEVHRAVPVAAPVRPLPNGAIDLGDGTIVSARGRVVARGPDARSATAATAGRAASGPSWDPLVYLSNDISYEDTLDGAVFDASGDAWVTLAEPASSDWSLSVMQSSGVSGSWVRHTLVSEGFHASNQAKIAAAPDGTIHVVYRWLGGAGYELRAFMFTPGFGWTGPTTVYSSPYFFQNISVAADSAGNCVVIFDRETTQWVPEVWSVVRSNASGTWGTAVRVSPSGEVAFLQTLARSSDGAHVMLVYFRYPGGSSEKGILWSGYSATTQTWDPPALIPQTSQAAIGSAGQGAGYPFTMDTAGNATLIASILVNALGGNAIYGYRYEGGSWQSPAPLVTRGQNFQDIGNFGAAAVNASGAVLGINAAAGAAGARVDVFHFTPGQGWNTRVVGFYTNPTISRSRVAWFGAAGQAVATYEDLTVGALTTRVYANGAWSLSPAIPGKPGAWFLEALTAASGEVLLVLEPIDGGVAATWLRP